LPGGFHYAYQVNRDLFDHLLAFRAQAKGAKVLYGLKVLDWVEQNESILISTSEGEFKSRYLIDANSQSSLMARRAGIKSFFAGFG
jgi:flavin-dependent dehydrogenase